MSVRYSLGAESKAGQRSGKGSFILNLVEMARTGTFPDLQHLSDRQNPDDRDKTQDIVLQWITAAEQMDLLEEAGLDETTEILLMETEYAAATALLAHSSALSEQSVLQHQSYAHLEP